MRHAEHALHGLPTATRYNHAMPLPRAQFRLSTLLWFPTVPVKIRLNQIARMPLPRPRFRLSTLLWPTLAVACWFGGMRFGKGTRHPAR